jgi:membrane protein implicated in regulation of membrane protease activity
MSAMSVSWLATGVALCAVLVLTILLWVQWLHTQQHKAELSVLRDLLQSLGEVVQRLEQEKAELTAGLRAEKGQVEQLKRQLGQLR